MSQIQSKQEELFNVLTHGVGIILSIIGFLVLTLSYNPDLIDLIFIVIYGISLILLFSASTIYHYVSLPKHKRALRKLDHISIYVLIAGTYTPVCMSVLKDSRGLMLFILVWSITAIGLILKLFFTGKFEKISLLLYLIMGWLIVLDFQNLYEAISETALTYLILGGAFYTGGVIFYVMHKLKYHHVIWHVFVLLGALFHFLMIKDIIT
jgi:hemolysin III